MSSDSHKASNVRTYTRYWFKRVLLYRDSNRGVHFRHANGAGIADSGLTSLFDMLLKDQNQDNLAKAYIDARVVGSVCQAGLLLESSEALQKTGRGAVRFISPRILRATAHTPAEVAFEAMLREDVPSATITGGWRPVGVTEFKSFQFLNDQVSWCVHPAACVVDALLPRQFQRKLKVVGDLPQELKASLSQLLRLVEDPRWFLTCDSIAADHPLDRTRELENYFGVNESFSTVAEALAAEHLFEPRTDAEKRLLVLLRVCLGLETCPLRVKSFQLRTTNSLLTSLIRGYFHAILPATSNWELTKCLSSVSGPVAVAFALRTILRFIADYWLHETTPTGWEFFVPKYFFEETAITYSYRFTGSGCVAAGVATKSNDGKTELLTPPDVAKLASSVEYARSAWPFKLGYKPLCSV